MNVHIIGGGNLGASIAIGIAKFTTGNQVTVTRRNTSSILHLEKLGITVSTDNKHQIQEADIIILTIKISIYLLGCRPINLSFFLDDSVTGCFIAGLAILPSTRAFALILAVNSDALSIIIILLIKI